MPANREVAAYGAVAVGAAIAVALIRWMPPMPVSAVSRPVVVPKTESPAVPSQPVPTLPRPEILSSRLTAPPTLERHISALAPKIEPAAPRRTPVPVARPSSRRAPSPSPVVNETVSPSMPASPETEPQKSPAAQIELPMPIIAPPASRPIGIRARVGDAAKFKEKVQQIASQFSATVVFKESIRIEVSADRRSALKSALDRAIFEFLSDDGTDIQIDLVSP